MKKERRKKKKQGAAAVPVLVLLCLLGTVILIWQSRSKVQAAVSAETPAAEQTAQPPSEPAASSLPQATPEPTQEPTPEPTTEPTPEPSPETVHYSIPEEARVAPAPLESCYGTVSMDEPEKILPVIQQARDWGLLGEDEMVAFDPTVSFYRGLHSRDIEYYLDETILAILWKENVDGLCCTFTEVKVADPSQFRRKLAEDTYNAANQYYASDLAAQTQAVVALNADFYRFRDVGIVAADRQLYRFKTSVYTGSYKLYNCVETLFVDAKGDFLYKRLGEENTEESIRQFMEENDVLFSVAFGPVLIEDGQPIPCTWYPVGEVNQGYSRAGIGQMGPCHYLYMSLNHGDQPARWTVSQFAEHFAEKPVLTAYCLDGGQTEEVVFRGIPYNYMDFGKERLVSDILYFATAIPEDAR